MFPVTFPVHQIPDANSLLLMIDSKLNQVVQKDRTQEELKELLVKFADKDEQLKSKDQQLKEKDQELKELHEEKRILQQENSNLKFPSKKGETFEDFVQSSLESLKKMDNAEIKLTRSEAHQADHEIFSTLACGTTFKVKIEDKNYANPTINKQFVKKLVQECIDTNTDGAILTMRNIKSRSTSEIYDFSKDVDLKWEEDWNFDPKMVIVCTPEHLITAYFLLKSRCQKTITQTVDQNTEKALRILLDLFEEYTKMANPIFSGLTRNITKSAQDVGEMITRLRNSCYTHGKDEKVIRLQERILEVTKDLLAEKTSNCNQKPTIIGQKRKMDD